MAAQQAGYEAHRRLNQQMMEMMQRMYPNELGKVATVVLSSSETARQALKDHDLACCGRPRLAGPRDLSYNCLDISFSPFNDYWKDIRKLSVQELFSTKKIHSIQPIKDEEVKKLINSLTESAPKKTPVNLNQKFLTLTTSVLCRVAFSVSFEDTVLSNNKLYKLIREVYVMLGSFSASDYIPYVGWIVDRFTGNDPSEVPTKCSSEFSDGSVPRKFPMKIPRNISSELPRIGPSESPSKYPEEVLPRYIPRSFSTNWWSSEFLRKFFSLEFRRKFRRKFRGKMNFRGVISEDLFRRYVIGITLFRQHTVKFFSQYVAVFL
uniref:Cytochrome P450 n=1 Tax=Brassica oleracea var. oleracea TaxID=109376 RepID=A0A0D3AP51_BRAOL